MEVQLSLQKNRVYLVTNKSKFGGVDKFVNLFSQMFNEQFEIVRIAVDNPFRRLAIFKPLARLFPEKIKSELLRIYLSFKTSRNSAPAKSGMHREGDRYLFTHPRQLNQMDVPKSAKRLVMYHDSASNFMDSGVLAEFKNNLRKSDTLVLLSLEDVEQIKSKIPVEVVCIENPTDRDFLGSPNLAKFAREQRKFLMLTRFVSQKRVLTAVGAWRASRAEELGYVLEIYGEGWMKPIVKLAILIRRIKGIRILPFTSDPSFAMGKCSFLLNSSIHEGLPFSYLEALVQGVPIVATPSGPGADKIVQSQSGLLASANTSTALAEKIVGALNLEDDEYIDLLDKSSNLLQTYSMDRIAQKWLQLLE